MKFYLLNLKRVLIIVMIKDIALLRLFQLVSPGLPIGMYSYSQGLERAVEDPPRTRFMTGLKAY